MSGDDDVPVGYGNPPRHHRVKPNEVRNPWGRKGRPRAQVDFLDEPFELKIDGQTMRITRGEALDYALSKTAAAGNVSAIKELERRRRDRAVAAATNAGDDRLAPEDQRAFERCLDRALRDKAIGCNGAAGQPSTSQHGTTGTAS